MQASHDAHGHGGAAPWDFPATIASLAAAGIALLAIVGQVASHEGHEEHAKPAEAPPLSLPSGPDFVLANARIVAPGLEPASVLVVRGGKIEAVGDAALLEGLEKRRPFFDARGAVVIPGLRDAHGHLSGLGAQLKGRVCDLEPATTRAAVVEIFEKWMQEKKPAPGRWLSGRGWDESKWPREGTSPDPSPFAEIARLTPRNPTILLRVDGHAAWANPAALAAAKIGRDTQDPPDGAIERDARGEPTGLLVDGALTPVARLLPAETDAEVEEDLLRAAEECARKGLVEVHEAGADAREESALRRLAASGKLKVRVYCMIGRSGEDLRKRLEKDPEREIGGRLAIRSVKLYADGAMGSHGALLLEPYADKPDSRGIARAQPEELEQVASLCAKRGYQLCVHAIGDAANRRVLDAFEKSGAGKSARFRIEHAQLVEPVHDLPRFARLGVIASMQPTHATTDMRWAEDRVGAARLEGAYAWRSLLETGAHLAFGSDFPVESPDPLLGLYAAVTRQDARGEPWGGWRPRERLSPEEALRAFTEEVAFASFSEERRGKLVLGMDADLTLLDTDPLLVLATDARKLLRSRVLATYISGVRSR